LRNSVWKFILKCYLFKRIFLAQLHFGDWVLARANNAKKRKIMIGFRAYSSLKLRREKADLLAQDSLSRLTARTLGL
jgi:hypothetical protein